MPIALAAVALILAVAGAGGLGPPRTEAAHGEPQGFGASTRGGGGKPRYHVTTLANAGPGSLRDAISSGNRLIVFTVAGTIALESPLHVRGAFLTIDGGTAPSPGITIARHGLTIRGSDGSHDVIVRSLRIRGSATRETNAKTSSDCLAISRGAYNVLIDHVSISGCSDGGIDIVGDSSRPGSVVTRDVTVQWSVLADTRKTMLVKYGTTRIALHHNLFVRGLVRLPSVTREGLPVDTGTTLDMRNNVVWDWATGFGTTIHGGATANIVSNVYGNPGGAARDRRQAVVVCHDGLTAPDYAGICRATGVRADAYVAGNVSVDGVDIDRSTTVAAPFANADVTTTGACAAARAVLAQAGAQPRDQVDVDYVGQVMLTDCPS